MEATKNVNIGMRTTRETETLLRELAEMISNQVGTKISKSQAMEIAIREAVASRKSE